MNFLRVYPRNFLILITFTSMVGQSTVLRSQELTFQQKFERDLKSNDVKEGCKMTVYVASVALNTACVVPEPTVSKVACAAATALNAGLPAFADPNIPHPVFDAGVLACTISYSAVSNGLEYTFEFSVNKTEEIKRTWEWLNTLEGGIQVMNYLRNN